MARVTLPLITVVVPTIPGREDHLERCVTAYTNLAAGCYTLNLVIERGHPAVGVAWQAGAEKAAGEYLHLTNDDIEPHPGWHLPAIEAVQRGFLPAPQVHGPAGDPQSLPAWGTIGEDWAPVTMSTLPFMSRAQWEKIGPVAQVHYYADDYISYRGRKAGWPAVLRAGYSFTHYWARHGRGAGMTEDERMDYDRARYNEAVNADARGDQP
jgi:hypothetical protein